jgi:hypothetical protein
MHLYNGPFLAMTKPLGGVRPIVMGEALYRFTNCVLYIQFCEAFVTHFSPHQFGVTTKGGCETIIHDIRCTLNFHPNRVVHQLDVANTFNSMLKGVIFQKLCFTSGDIIQFIPFVYAFYVIKCPLLYSHYDL